MIRFRHINPEQRKARLTANETKRFIGGVATIRSGAAPAAILPELTPVHHEQSQETIDFLAAVHAKLRGEVQVEQAE